MVVNTPKKAVEKFPVKKKVEDTSVKPTETDSKLSTEEKVVEKPEEKKPIQKKPKKKKTEAFVNETSIPISTKHSTAICKFIKGKKIEKAISDLEKVIVKKKAVPMKGEIPHRKGMMSGRYPKKASEQFIKTLKRLKANAIVNEIENPMIVTAIANLGSRPYGKFGRVRKKRTHLKIIAKETKEKIVKKERKK
jgi:large subunit ribosomal protein L22